MDDMGERTAALLSMIDEVDVERWLKDPEDQSLLVNALRMVLNWEAAYYQLRITDRLFTGDELTRLQAAHAAMEPVRASLDAWAARIPTRRRHLGAVQDIAPPRSDDPPDPVMG